MKITKIAMMSVLALSLGACAKKDAEVDEIPLANGSGSQQGGTNANGTGAGGITSSNLDPSSTEYFKQTIGDRVFFAVDQTGLTPDAAAILDKQATWLIANPNVTILIEGHADEQGTREYNLALGAQRASAVSNYLVSKGVPDSRVKTITYGKERPVEVCSTEDCYSKNRRAVTVVAGGLGA